MFCLDVIQNQESVQFLDPQDPLPLESRLLMDHLGRSVKVSYRETIMFLLWLWTVDRLLKNLHRNTIPRPPLALCPTLVREQQSSRHNKRSKSCATTPSSG